MAIVEVWGGQFFRKEYRVRAITEKLGIHFLQYPANPRNPQNFLLVMGAGKAIASILWGSSKRLS